MKLIDKLFQKQDKLHFSLIDPSNQKPKKAAQTAIICENYGTDAFLVGGSTVNKRKDVYNTISAIKKSTNVPVILFPNSAKSVAKNADGILFMRLLNSKDINYTGDQQFKAIPNIKKQNIDVISTGYIVVNTSRKLTTVEKLTDLDIIQINDVDKAIKYSLLAQYFDMHYVYLEAGSGAEQPISNEMISAVKENTKIPLIVGGGINDGETAYRKLRAGADIIVTGTIIEKNPKNLENIIKEIHKF